jgi:multidrug efflux pump subunit AcrA (membrane-fusion protein)
MAIADKKAWTARSIGGMMLAVAVYVVTAALAFHVTQIYLDFPQTDDAYVRANTVGIAPHVSGPIVDLRIRDNQRVKKGELLFTVDPRPYQADLDAAVANVELTNLGIAASDHSIAAAKARQIQFEADREYDQQYLERIAPLLNEDFVTADEVSSAKSKLAAARAAVQNAKSEVARASNELGEYGDINAQCRVLLCEGAVRWLRDEPQYRCRPICERGQGGREPGRQPRLVRAGEFSRDLSRADSHRDARGGLSAGLPERTISRASRRRRMGAVPGKWRDRRGAGAGGTDAQLGAAGAAFSGAHQPGRRRSAISIPDG